MKPIIHILAVFLACIAFSCRSVQYVPVETIKSDTTYIYQFQRDSIYERDSIYVHGRNDTVFVEKYKYKYIDRIVKDTAYVSRTDSIQVPYPVEKKLTRWQKIKMDLGGISIGIIIIIILVVVGRAVYFLKK
ncbi:MAG: hypothetical protein MSK40_16850 [Parabacteroides sp.]|nr:hypothetical protein [Parabacteroides sp.]